MVYSSADAVRSTYLLWHRFKFQTDHGIRDAVAVPERAGTQLVSAYGFMLQIIYLHIWAAAVLTGVYFSIRKRQLQLARVSSGTDSVSEHDILRVSADVWDGRSDPSAVLRTMGTHKAWRSRGWWVPLAWFLAALAALVINYAIPIVIIPNLVIGNGAPVNPNTIYVPSIATNTIPYQIQIANLENPSALRAAGSISAVNLSTADFIHVNQPTTLTTLADGSPVLQINYDYSIRSRDFGLQHYRDLTFNVNGSCYTEYNWWASEDIVDGTPVDTYYLWNDTTDPNNQVQVSLYDGAVPLVYFFHANVSQTPEGTNTTYAAVVSSIGRKSVFQGSDPWYLTNTTAVDNLYTVLGGRPALSCWQMDSWTSQGKSVNLTTIAGLPGLSNFPEPLNSVFVRFLSPPKILTVATHLGTRALESSTSSLGENFNANTSSLYNDFSRLVTTAYIASANTLTETTLFSRNFPDVPNMLAGKDQTTVADFVVFSSNISTLAVLDVIVIPVVALGLWILVLGLIWWEGRQKGRIRMLEKFKAKLLARDAEEEEGQRSEEASLQHGEIPKAAEAGEITKTAEVGVEG
jgi:hypothetical protein